MKKYTTTAHSYGQNDNGEPVILQRGETVFKAADVEQMFLDVAWYLSVVAKNGGSAAYIEAEATRLLERLR